ncbi:uroporphyrinogen decarboxylase [Marinilabiliaceae bacterium ANBcel2]|nr:uroporphyrinogen decarboxylase [Marinilabiliaceae bacterium ANBcel2]
MQKTLLLKKLNKEATARPPVWFMRQAGRVLPSYNKIKENYSFREMMANPEIAADVTLLPIKDLGVDAAILFSDILVVPVAMGMELEWTANGPLFPTPLSNYLSPVDHLNTSPQKLEHIYQVIDEIIEKRDNSTPLIGFCGSPLTTMCYMLQGESRKHDFPEAVKFLYQNERESQKLIDAITELSVYYAQKQIEHGVDVFQLFETHAGLIPFELYQEFFIPAVEKISNAVRSKGTPFIYFPKGLGTGLKYVTPDLCDYVSIDWQMPLTDARQLVHSEVGLQGNIDPRLLYSSKERISKELEKYKSYFANNNNRWIMNLGHGFLPDIPFENAKFVVDWVKNSKWY